MKNKLAAPLLILCCAIGLPTIVWGASIEEDEAIAIYEQWLEFYADRNPEAAIEMTRDDFVMVNNETVLDRARALAFTQALRDFILSRECTHQVLLTRATDKKGRLLLARVDCSFQTVQGPLDASFLETIMIDKAGDISYDHFTDVAQPSL